MPTTDALQDFPTLLLVLLTVFAVAALLYLSAVLFMALRRGVCPACQKRALRCVQWIRTTSVVDGKKIPDMRSYHACVACGAHFRKNLDASFTPASDMEWRQYCTMK